MAEENRTTGTVFDCDDIAWDLVEMVWDLAERPAKGSWGRERAKRRRVRREVR